MYMWSSCVAIMDASRKPYNCTCTFCVTWGIELKIHCYLYLALPFRCTCINHLSVLLAQPNQTDLKFCGQDLHDKQKKCCQLYSYQKPMRFLMFFWFLISKLLLSEKRTREVLWQRQQQQFFLQAVKIKANTAYHNNITMI